MACVGGKNINIFKIYGYDYPLKKLVGHADGIWDLLLFSDQQHLLSNSNDKTMRMWDIQRASCIRIFIGHSKSSKMVFFQETIVAVAYEDGNIKLWNIHTGQCVRTLSKNAPQFGLVMGTDGELISCGNETTISVWG